MQGPEAVSSLIWISVCLGYSACLIISDQWMVQVQGPIVPHIYTPSTSGIKQTVTNWNPAKINASELGNVWAISDSTEFAFTRKAEQREAGFI